MQNLAFPGPLGVIAHPLTGPKTDALKNGSQRTSLQISVSCRVPDYPGFCGISSFYSLVSLFNFCSIYSCSRDHLNTCIFSFVSSPCDTWLCNLQNIVCVLIGFLWLCPKHKKLTGSNDSICKINSPCHCLRLIFLIKRKNQIIVIIQHDS